MPIKHTEENIRSRLEQKMDILRAIEEGSTKPTNIMYSAKISWISMLERMNELLEKGLVEKNPGINERSRFLYSITTKGKFVLEQYLALKSI